MRTCIPSKFPGVAGAAVKGATLWKHWLHRHCTFQKKKKQLIIFIIFKGNRPTTDCPNFTMVREGQTLPKSRSSTEADSWQLYEKI